MDKASHPSFESGRSEDEPHLEHNALGSDAEISNGKCKIETAGDDPDDSSQKYSLDTSLLNGKDAEKCSTNGDDSEFLDDKYDEDDWPKIVISEKGLYAWGFKKTDFGNFGDDQDEEGAARFRELLSLFDLEEAPLEVSTFRSIKFVWCSRKDSRYLKLVSTINPISGQDGHFWNNMELSKTNSENYPTVLSRGYLGYSGVESDSAELLREFIMMYRKLAADIVEESNGRAYI
jgi:hypothetical protein